MKVVYKEAQELYESGQSVVTIAEYYDVTPSAIRHGFKVRGVETRRRPKPTIPEKNAIIYFAGLFDGEGHITIATSKNKAHPSYWLQIGVSGTFTSVLHEMKDAFSCGHFSVSRRDKRNGHRDCIHWRATSTQAAHVLRCLLPHLRVKREQATLAIQFQEKLSSRVDTTNKWKEDCKQSLRLLKDATS